MIRSEAVSAQRDPQMIAFCCSYCACSAAALAGSRRMQYAAGVRIIQTPCTGKLEMEHVLAAFEKGIDAVLVVGCLEGGCHYHDGNVRARNRIDRLRALLDELGLGSERLRMVNLSDAMASEFVQSVNAMDAVVRNIGPNPLAGSRSEEESRGEP